MKIFSQLLAFALFFIALSAYSMPTGPVFQSSWGVTPAISAKEDIKAKKPKKSKKAKAKKGGGVTFYEGSAESRLERDKRLVRECKGRPNSGVCEGYTR
jgi:hypothetical protein